MHKLLEGKVDGIKAELHAGRATRFIAHKFGVSQASVNRIAKTSDLDVVRPKAGRPGRVSMTSRRLLVRQITTGILENAVQVQRYLHEELNVEITANRVRQILKEEVSQTLFNNRRYLGLEPRKKFDP